MLNKDDHIRKEGYTFIFKCKKCPREIKSKRYYFVKHTGMCRSCCVKKKPFEHLFNKLKNTSKFEKHSLDLTYADFLEFTLIKECHYCYTYISWNPYLYKDSKYTIGSYFLDRKDNLLGYSLQNCVVCCKNCNMAKGNRYSYEDWYGMTSYFRNKTV